MHIVVCLQVIDLWMNLYIDDPRPCWYLTVCDSASNATPVKIFIQNVKFGVTYIIQKADNSNIVCSSCSTSTYSMYFLFLLTDVMNAVLNVTTNPANASVECMFEPGYNCIIHYGTDSSYTNLTYIDNSTTLGQVATITLSQKLQIDTTYYFIASAESDSQCVGVRGILQTGGFIYCVVHILTQI